MLRAIAIDDEPPALKVIESHCLRSGGVDLVKVFTNPTLALFYLDENPVDLVFLDIKMPSISGMDLAKKISSKTMVVFTTAYGQFAVEGFEVNALDYLLKPISYDRFAQTIEKAKNLNILKSNALSSERFIFIKENYASIKIELGNIFFIESIDDYLKVHLKTGETHLSRMTMKSIIEKLPAEEFIRVHRSFILPKNLIKNIRNKTIYLENSEIPIGISYEEEVMKKLNLG